MTIRNSSQSVYTTHTLQLYIDHDNYDGMPISCLKKSHNHVLIERYRPPFSEAKFMNGHGTTVLPCMQNTIVH